MPDRMSAETRSRVMSKIKGKDTGPERLLRSALHLKGLRFRKNLKSIPGSPDIAFTGKQVAIFVDGDFWHGRHLDAWLEAGRFNERREYWENKLRRNIARDERVNNELAALGWRVLRYWESDIRSDLVSIANEIEQIVKSRPSGKGRGQSLVILS